MRKLGQLDYNRYMNKNTTPQLVQDRKTGQWYNPAVEFDKLLNSPTVKETISHNMTAEIIEARRLSLNSDIIDT